MTNEQTEKANGKSVKGILFLHALTPLHPGSGSALGAVDLPVQRERHTQWPVITGSSLKGVIRDECRPEKNGETDEKNQERFKEYQKWLAVFGPESKEESSAHAGAVNFTDARILAFPVRSLKGVFAWTTSPAVLLRFKRDLQIAGISTQWTIPDLPKVSKNDSDPKSWALFSDDDDSALKIAESDQIVLEEFDFTQYKQPSPENKTNEKKTDEKKTNNITLIASDISQAIPHEETKKTFPKHFAILSDDDFTYFVRNATEVATRIQLNPDTKTVKGKALFSEELIPPETLFYSIAIAEESKRHFEKETDTAKNVSLTPSDVIKYLEKVPQYIQLGGDATIGKGFCAKKICDKKYFEELNKKREG
ncbi:type III-B CRISPR module RAMP protein Cmr4 [Candidatus Sumerlaeota bacterium]|nr:type III-B CRISPR module RAMP protein Cmr4 [Candidatus Sumerlaeota bacterium]